MANAITPNLDMIAPEVGSDVDQWGAHLNTDLYILDALFAPDGSGTSVGLRIGTTMVLQIDSGATLNISPGATVNMPAASLYIEDASDLTKIVKFAANAITTGTTRTFIWPDEDGIVATQAYVATQRQIATGTIVTGFYGNASPTGTLFANGFTIGSASSGAQARANADTLPLYQIMWNYLGYTPTGGRGVDALTDFNNNKPIALPDLRGRVQAALDNLGGAGNANILSPSGIASTTPGAVGGAATESTSYSGNVTATGTTSGTLSYSGTSSSQTPAQLFAGSGGGSSFPYVGDHTHTYSGATVGNLAVSTSGTSAGTTASVTNTQPTIMVQTVIYL